MIKTMLFVFVNSCEVANAVREVVFAKSCGVNE